MSKTIREKGESGAKSNREKIEVPCLRREREREKKIFIEAFDAHKSAKAHKRRGGR